MKPLKPKTSESCAPGSCKSSALRSGRAWALPRLRQLIREAKLLRPRVSVFKSYTLLGYPLGGHVEQEPKMPASQKDTVHVVQAWTYTCTHRRGFCRRTEGALLPMWLQPAGIPAKVETKDDDFTGLVVREDALRYAGCLKNNTLNPPEHLNRCCCKLFLAGTPLQA